MNSFIKNLLCLLIIFPISGCVKGVKTEVVQKSEFSYLKFTGNTNSISVIIDDGKYNFTLSESSSSKKETLYKVDKGKHRIKVYQNNNLIIDRMIFLENHVTTEINIP